jgi:hypothetical protein
MKKNVSLVLMLIVTALLSACASGPAYKDVQSSIPSLRSDKGRIYFYRTAMMGAAVQPGITLNGAKVGSAVPGGFFYVDQAPGNCEVIAATEAENKLTFTLDRAQTRYVRLDMQMGLFVGHVVPRLVDETDAQKEISTTKYVGPALQPTKVAGTP